MDFLSETNDVQQSTCACCCAGKWNGKSAGLMHSAASEDDREGVKAVLLDFVVLWIKTSKR